MMIMKLKVGQRLPFKRRRLQKTDYAARLKLLKSGLPRFVVRKGNDNIRVQLIEWSETGDKTKIEEISRNLRKLGWKGHGGSTPAAYLTGFLLGKKASKAGIKNAIFDIGLQRSSKGGAIYAAVKGAKDAGLDVPMSDEILPDTSRVRGEHIAAYAKKLKTDGNERQFAKTDAQNAVKNFDEVKAKIERG